MRVRSWLALSLAAMMLVAGCGGAKAPATQTTAPAAGAAEAAKTWKPTKQVTLVVPYAAGGSTDLLARAVEKVWSKYSEQPLIVVTKAGAGGYEGRESIVNGQADGYTLMMGLGSGEDLVTPKLRKTVTDVDSFAPVARLSVHSVVVAVPANSEIKDIKGLVEWQKKNNKPVTAAVSTAGAAVDIVMRGIGKTANIPVTGVPHSGGSQAVTTLVGGQTVTGGGHPSEVMPHVKAGRLRAIAVATPERDPALPDIPTLKEQGVNFSTWGSVKGIGMNKKTAPEAIAYYEDVFKKISEDPDFKKAMADLMQPIMYQNAKDFGAFLKQASDDYAKLIKDLNITLQ